MKARALDWQKWGRRSLWTLAVLLAVIAFSFFVLPRMSVNYADTVTRVDVIYLGAFDPRLHTDEHVVSLYRQGVAPKIVCFGNAITCDIFPADFARQQLIDLGIPAGDILVFHTPDTDCRAQLAAPLIGYAQQHGWRSVLMYGDPAGSHMMRKVLQPKFKAAGIDLYIAFPDIAKKELLDGWWREHWKMQRMMREPLESGLDLFFSECW